MQEKSRAQRQENKKIESITAIRGVAVLMVAICHFFSVTGLNLTTSLLDPYLNNLGHMGVHLFFIVSGFVLPYSMYKSGYSFSSLPRFLLRRVVRIEPPYLISIVLVLVCMLAKHLYGLQVNYEGGVIGVLSQVFYLNGILKLPWVNVVYWSLALEFQFYLLIGLIFVALKDKRNYVLALLLSLIATLRLLDQTAVWILGYLPFFMIGMGLCCYRLKKLNLGAFLLVLIISTVLLNYPYGLAENIDTLLTISIFMLLYFMENLGFPSWILFVGKISYSIYLVHNILVAGLAVFDPYPLSLAIRIALSAIVLLISIYVSYLFFKWVEAPFLAKAQRLKR